MPVFAAGERQIDQVISFSIGRRGTLYLTDRRVIFEWSEGLLTKRYHQLGISLADIQAVNTNHPRFGGGELVITTKDANNGFRTNRVAFGVAMTPETWQGKINALLNQVPVQQPQGNQTVIVQKEVVKVPCKYCRTLNDPYDSNLCARCGAPIHIA
jgi:hypothetical protein